MINHVTWLAPPSCEADGELNKEVIGVTSPSINPVFGASFWRLPNLSNGHVTRMGSSMLHLS